MTECKDCKAERERRGEPEPPKSKLRRIQKDSGGRCASHFLQVRRERKGSAHERRVVKTYGLELGQYNQIYVHQGQVCAICQRARGIAKNLAVDHDHKNGLVRGLLCSRCNQLLGHLRDDWQAAQRIVNYLLRPPAQQLGIVAIHEDFRKEERDGAQVRLRELPEAGDRDQEQPVQESLDRRW